jgi:hypothetical protein
MSVLGAKTSQFALLLFGFSTNCKPGVPDIQREHRQRDAMRSLKEVGNEVCVKS